MRVVIQRVSEASVTIEKKLFSSIKKGLLVFAGFEDSDNETDLEWMSNKIINLRIFDDENNVPNLSLKDISGEILLVSQFTLHALTKKGNRPSYIKASKPEISFPLYEKFVRQIEKDFSKTIATGVFGADMKIALINDGPITIWIDSKQKE